MNLTRALMLRRLKGVNPEHVMWNTKREYSTIFIPADVKDAIPSGEGGAKQAYAVFKRGTFSTSFFGYGLNDNGRLDDGFGNQFTPTLMHTSLDKAMQLQPKTMMSIEAICLLGGHPRAKFEDAPADVADAVVTAAYTGELVDGQPVEVFDPTQVIQPGALTVFPHMAVEALRDACTIEYVIGSGNIGGKRLGPLRFLPSGPAEALSKGFGAGQSTSWYQIGEGLLWDIPENREGLVTFRLTLHQDVVVPFKLGEDIVGSEDLVAPTRIAVPLTLVVSGPQITVGALANGA